VKDIPRLQVLLAMHLCVAVGQLELELVEIPQLAPLFRADGGHFKVKPVRLQPRQRAHAMLDEFHALLLVLFWSRIPGGLLRVIVRLEVGRAEKGVQEKAAEGAAKLGGLDKAGNARRPFDAHAFVLRVLIYNELQ
jgi:hypothetical protein